MSGGWSTAFKTEPRKKRMPSKKKSAETVVAVAEVRQYEAVVNQLRALAEQFKGQTSKKPDSPINKFKLSVVNEKLAAANKLLQGEFKPLDSFEEFSDADLPTNSDVSLVLSAYLSSLERWRSARVLRPAGDHKWYWRTPGDSVIEGDRPTKFQPEE